jgi:hypothetical protein
VCARKQILVGAGMGDTIDVMGLSGGDDLVKEKKKEEA